MIKNIKTVLQEKLFGSRIYTSANKIICLIIVIATMIFVIIKPSIYPLGDDFWHLEGVDRSIPIPMMYLTNGSRVIDKYVTYHTFRLFEKGYSELIGAPRYDNFFKIFQFINATVYAIIYTLLTYISSSLTKKSEAKPTVFQFCVVMSASIIIFQQMPYISMTDLFAYQLTACLTIIFLVTLFPIKTFLGKQKLQECKPSTVNIILYSFLAYSVSVGIESFVVLSWIYIVSYYCILIAKEACNGSKIKYAVNDALDKARLIILLQFFLYSAWSMFAVLTSRREAMLIAEGKQLEKIDFIETLHTFLLSNAGTYIIVLLLTYLVYLSFYSRSNVSKVKEINSSTNPEKFWLVAFLMLLVVGYSLVLWLQSWLTNINYFVAKFTMPIVMILFISLSAALSYGFQNSIRIFPMAMALSIALAFELVSFRKKCENLTVTADQLRHVFMETSNNVKQGSFQVNFQLPLNNNDGYPLLPGINAQSWFRRTYRNILNRYYLSGFNSRQAPIFYEKKEDTK